VSEKRPVHGFVLAGGKSSRMGTDKALLEFHGRPLVEIAVEKLREFCTEVSIAGNRDDLSRFATVVREERVDCGPAAGIEAGLKAAKQDWALFVPVDVPLVPGELLQRWVEEVIGLGKNGMGASFLLSNAGREPTFCVVRRDCVARVSEALDKGDRRVDEVLLSIDGSEGDSWVEARCLTGYAKSTPSDLEMERWFTNVNTPHDLEVAEAWAAEANPLRG
jgi:molybdopterin-guanine dinucleotide biosynthesis protein A